MLTHLELSVLEVRGPLSPRPPNRLRPTAEEARELGGLGPEVPGCEGGRYVSASEEMCCVVVVGFTKWAKRRRVCDRVDFVKIFF